MNVLKKISVICFIILSSCSLSEENLQINQDQVFYEKIAAILENPTSYSSLSPQKINPFDFDLSKKLQESDKSGARVHENSSERSALPDEIANASIEFQTLSITLIQKSGVLDNEDFRKLAYAVELEVINSKLSETKKEFLLKELAKLKALKSLLEKKLENARIMCDSKFECEVLACVEAKVAAALDPDENNWIDLAYNIYFMATDMPRWWASCAWDALTGG
jgi:hypothetical protein